MAHRIELTRRAARELKRLPPSARERIVRAIDALAENPRPRGALPLSRDHSEFRLRVGDFRIVYYIEEDALVVVAIGHRRDVYRRLL